MSTSGWPTIAPRGEGVVDVWLARPAALRDPRLAARWERWLTPAESSRRRAFVREVNRQEYLVTRALVRSILSVCQSMDPAALRFATNPYGRPHLDPPCGLWFNLSNTTELVACGVSRDGEVGVDVEPLDRGPDVVEVADTVFSPRELRELRSIADPAALRDRALDLWTLKESYIKARGMGLSLPLDRFSFVFDDPARLTIAIDPSLADDPARWRFRRLDVAGHRLAVCAERVAPRELDVRVHDVTELLAR